jgi:hypothetical protein
MEFRNLTPHSLNILTPEGRPALDIPSAFAHMPASERAACCPRVAMAPGAVEYTAPEGFTVAGPTNYGEVTNLPAPEGGVYLVVSGAVLAAVGASRPDVVAPGELVRGPDGQPIGCRGLRR